MNDEPNDPTPRERGRKTCRAALMSVISLHRRADPLDTDPQLAQAVVAATVALMDLDGLRGDIGEEALADAARGCAARSTRQGDRETCCRARQGDKAMTMTAGEQMVWAARFAGAVSSGCKPEVAARMATRESLGEGPRELEGPLLSHHEPPQEIGPGVQSDTRHALVWTDDELRKLDAAYAGDWRAALELLEVKFAVAGGEKGGPDADS